MLLGIAFRSDQQGGSAVHHARRVAGMVNVVHLAFDLRVLAGDHVAIGVALVVDRDVHVHVEHGFQAGEAFHRRLRTRELFMVERQCSVHVVNRHDRLVEAAFGDGAGGALLADDGELVNGLAVDAFQRRDRIGADALLRLRMAGAQAQVAHVHGRRGFRISGGRGVAHHFAAAGDDAIFHAGHDLRGRQRDGGDARAAETVERDAGRLDVEAGIERGHAAHVGALRAALAGGAPDDVVDRGGVELVAVAQRAEHRRGEVLRVHVGEGALANFANAARGADGVNDIGFGHDESPCVDGPSAGGVAEFCFTRT